MKPARQRRSKGRRDAAAGGDGRAASAPAVGETTRRVDVLLELLVENLPSHLDDRSWSLRSGQRAAFHHIFALESGAADIHENDQTTRFAAPGILLVPAGAGDELRVKAGSSGRLLAATDAALGRAMLSSPELQPLWRAIQARAPLVIAGDADIVRRVADSAGRIGVEVADRHAGAALAALSHLTIVFVLLCRMMAVNFLVDPTRNPVDLLARFRRLIDERLRERWSVADYARALGVSADRLHDVCRRKLNRTPSQLIQECVLQTAGGILERPEIPIKQVSFLLGFKDPTYFNRFFRRHMSLPPGLYRRRYASASSEGDALTRRTFADWP